MAVPTGVDLKIKRAKEHICDLEARLLTFKNGNPYGVIPKLDSSTGEKKFHFRATQSIPAEIPLRTGEVIQNLRSALDYVVWALVVVKGWPKRERDIGFPISESADKYKADRPRKVEGMCKGAIDAINLTKPYKGGTEELWQLHELNNREKHRLLLAAGIGFRVTTQQRFPAPHVVTAGGVGRMLVQAPVVNIDSTPANAVFPVIDGDEIFAVPADANMDPQFTFDVAFNESKIIEGKPILPFLHQLTHRVEGIVGTLGSFL